MSEWFKCQRELQGLKLGEWNELVTDTREEINLHELTDVLRTKGDFSRAMAYQKKYLDDKLQRFLNKEDLTGRRAMFCSFPRSGNTFLRKYVELVSGVPTGSELMFGPMCMQLSGILGE